MNDDFAALVGTAVSGLGDLPTTADQPNDANELRAFVKLAKERGIPMKRRFEIISQSAGNLGAKLSGWVKDMERLVEGSRAEVRQVQMELAEKNEELARTVARAEKEVGAARAETKAARLELTAAVSDKEAAVAAPPLVRTFQGLSGLYYVGYPPLNPHSNPL